MVPTISRYRSIRRGRLALLARAASDIGPVAPAGLILGDDLGAGPIMISSPWSSQRARSQRRSTMAKACDMQPGSFPLGAVRGACRSTLPGSPRRHNQNAVTCHGTCVCPYGRCFGDAQRSGRSHEGFPANLARPVPGAARARELRFGPCQGMLYILGMV